MKSEHIIAGVVYPGWEKDIEAHVERLWTTLSLPKEALTWSYDSLDMVQAAIHAGWLNRSFSEIQSELFGPLTAYAGEIIRRDVGGEWRIVEDARLHCLVPWVVGPRGEWYSVFRVVVPFYKDPALGSLNGDTRAIRWTAESSPT